VVAAVKFAGAFNGLYVFGFLHHADDVEVSFGVGADAACVGFGDVSANVAVGDAVAECGNSVCEAVNCIGFLVEEVEGDTLSTFGAYSGEASELVNEVLDGSFIHLVIIILYECGAQRFLQMFDSNIGGTAVVKILKES